MLGTKMSHLTHPHPKKPGQQKEDAYQYLNIVWKFHVNRQRQARVTGQQNSNAMQWLAEWT